MAYQPHPPFAFRAPVGRSVRWQRRPSQRPSPATTAAPHVPAPAAPGVILGVLYGLPVSLLLWAGIIAAAKVIF